MPARRPTSVLKGGIALTVGTASSCGRTLFAPLPDLRERKHNNDVVGSYRSPTRLRNVNWRLGPLVFLNSAPDVSISRISASRSCFGSLFFSLAALTLLALLTAIVRALRGAKGGTRGSGNFGRFFASSRRCLRVHGAGGLDTVSKLVHEPGIPGNCPTHRACPRQSRKVWYKWTI
jgi:hypothetical protein